jgi:hypothetical protein
MLVVKEPLSAPALACLEKLKVLDLSPITAYLMSHRNGYGWTKQQVFRAIRRYKTFVFVNYLYPQILLVPTQEIDQVWHCHILHTRQYRKDCELLFGCFIDHDPESELWGEANQHNLDAAFAQTQSLLALYERHFQEGGSGEFELHPVQRLELTKYQFQLGNDQRDLHFYRSACGRPAGN